MPGTVSLLLFQLRSLRHVKHQSFNGWSIPSFFWLQTFISDWLCSFLNKLIFRNLKSVRTIITYILNFDLLIIIRFWISLNDLDCVVLWKWSFFSRTLLNCFFWIKVEFEMFLLSLNVDLVELLDHDLALNLQVLHRYLLAAFFLDRCAHLLLDLFRLLLLPLNSPSALVISSKLIVWVGIADFVILADLVVEIAHLVDSHLAYILVFVGTEVLTFVFQVRVSLLELADQFHFIFFWLVAGGVRVEVVWVYWVILVVLLSECLDALQVRNHVGCFLCENIYMLLIEVFEHNLFTILINRVDCINNCTHTLNCEVFQLHKLLLKLLCFLESNLVLSVLNHLSVKSKRDFILTEVLKDCKVLIRHLVLNQSWLLDTHQHFLQLFLVLLLSLRLRVILLYSQKCFLLVLQFFKVVLSSQSSDL